MATIQSNYAGYLISSIDGIKLEVDIPVKVLQNSPNKNSLYSEMRYLTELGNRMASNNVDRTLYTDLKENEVTLDEYRQKTASGNDRYIYKTQILSGLLSLLYAVAKGKIFNVPLNPLNFIIDTDGFMVKGFYREDRPLPEVNDEWMNEVRKLIAFFMVDDSGLLVEDYETSSLGTILGFLKLDPKTYDVYTKLVGTGNITDMTKFATADDDYYPFSYVEDFPKWVTDFATPRDVSSYNPDAKTEDAGDSTEIPLDDGKKRGKKSKAKKEREPKPQRERPVRQQSAPKTNNNGGGSSAGSKILIALLAFAIGGGAMFGYNKMTAKNNAPKTESVKGAQGNINFYNGLLGATVQKYDVATASFDKFYETASQKTQNNLSDDEKVAIFFTYLLDGKYQDALDHDSSDSNAEVLIKYIKANSKVNYKDTIMSIKSDLAPIQFEQAVFNNDWATIASLKDKVKYSDDKTRQQEIAKALAKTDDIEGAVGFADDLNNKDLLNAIKAWAYEAIDAKTESQKDKTKDKVTMTNKMKEALKNTTNLAPTDLK